MFKQNRNLFVIAVIAVVNALGYGIIIPILYSYSQRFGLSDFQNGLLFATFSFCQFLATPLIGRMSDKYGRKPLLLISLGGTVISFLTMALAPSAVFLFLARALDGITAGNISVASAVISDTTQPKDRAKGFGIIGASFGFGFLFGPAISGLTVGLGASVPFFIAAGVTMVAIVLTAVILPETNVHIGQVVSGKIFDFKKLVHSALDVNVGQTLLVSLTASVAFTLFTYGFQPFALKVLAFTPQEISGIFTLIGLMGIFGQAIFVPRVVARFGDKKALTVSLGALSMVLFSLFWVNSVWILVLLVMLFSLANGFVGPMVNTLLSKETDAKSQGSILGLNASYVSVGMILGPIVGGLAATILLPLPFLLGSFAAAICFLMSFQILRKPATKVEEW